MSWDELAVANKEAYDSCVELETFGAEYPYMKERAKIMSDKICKDQEGTVDFDQMKVWVEYLPIQRWNVEGISKHLCIQYTYIVQNNLYQVFKEAKEIGDIIKYSYGDEHDIIPQLEPLLELWAQEDGRTSNYHNYQVIFREIFFMAKYGLYNWMIHCLDEHVQRKERLYVEAEKKVKIIERKLRIIRRNLARSKKEQVEQQRKKFKSSAKDFTTIVSAYTKD